LGAFGLDTRADQRRHLLRRAGWGRTDRGVRRLERRKTLFGSDTRSERDDAWLDPARDAAKIRAFFIDPLHARRGLGRRILERCEAEAGRAGFQRFEMMATLPVSALCRVRLYRGRGHQLPSSGRPADPIRADAQAGPCTE